MSKNSICICIYQISLFIHLNLEKKKDKIPINEISSEFISINKQVWIFEERIISLGFIIEKKRIQRKMKNKLEREKGKMRKLFLGLLENFKFTELMFLKLMNK